MKKIIVNEIISTICNIWNKNISQDYNMGILLEEDTLKCAFYYYLRRKLGKLMVENHLCIFTEYLGTEFKKMNYRPDMVIVKMKDNCDEEYLINHVEEVIVAIEFKFKGKYEYNSIIADREKIKNYVKRIDNHCQYVLAVIHEKYWENPYWFDNRQANNWAKGRVTELVANYDNEKCGNMLFQAQRY